MKSLGEILKLSAEHFEKCGVSRPRYSAEELLAHVLKIKRLDLYMQFDRPLLEEEIAQFRELVKQRLKREPLQYILGQVAFMDCLLHVNQEVLIPRQETEILLEKIFHRVGKASVVWDLCTGSGALAIGLKKKFPHLTLFASDISQKALEVAQKNATLNGTEIIFLLGDLLSPFKGKKADLVICNPPYISENAYGFLEGEVRDYEPKGALVGGVTGVEFYQQLATELPVFLNPGAKVCFEIGQDQGEALFEIFNAPIWKQKELEKDWANHDRFFFLEFE